MRQETWDSFWGELLLRRFHADDPARWTVRRERAARLFDFLNLHSGVRVLDLGCGDGILDICLAQLGAEVTAVDRISSIIAAARKEPGGEAVNYQVGDLRSLTFENQSFDAIIALEVVGLMSADDDRDLFRKALHWLADDGHIVVECPAVPSAAEGQSQRELDDGVIRGQWTYDNATRMLHMAPVFEAATGDVIELYDPYDAMRAATGVMRYVYHPDELSDILTSLGYSVEVIDEGLRGGQPLIVGSPAPSP